MLNSIFLKLYDVPRHCSTSKGIVDIWSSYETKIKIEGISGCGQIEWALNEESTQ